MKIQTKFQGELEVAEHQIFMFEKPLLGFEEARRFAIFPAFEEEASPFLMMQSMEKVDLAFYLVSPWIVEADYEFNLTPEQVELLGVTKPEEVNVMALVTLNSEVEKMTANLLAPLVVNVANQRAMQIVLQQTPYTTKHRILKSETA